jgi:hypothetical protein
VNPIRSALGFSFEIELNNRAVCRYWSITIASCLLTELGGTCERERAHTERARSS